MAYPVNPTEFRQPPHSVVSKQDDARLATSGFNFNSFLPPPPAPPATLGGSGKGLSTSGGLAIGIF